MNTIDVATTIESAQYVSIKYTERWPKQASNLLRAALEIPMTMLSPNHQRPLKGRGDPPSRSWRNFEAVEFATLEWVDWFNNRRLLEPIGNIPPAEAEQRYYAMLEQPAVAA